jgi:predicted GNAT family acetyltransferase
MDLTVRDAPERDRYEALTADGTVAGFSDYRPLDGAVMVTHTEVDPAHEGTGVASALVRGLLDDLREQGMAVVPRCPFLRGWLAGHAEYADLVRDH